MRKIPIIAALIFFVLNGVLLWKYNNVKKDINNYKLINQTLYETKRKCEQDLSNLNIHVKNNIVLNHNLISKNFLLEDMSSKSSILLEELVSNGKKIIFRIPKEPCSPCIDKVFSYLKKIEKHNAENIIIFMSDNNLMGSDKYDLTKYGIKTYITSADLPIAFETNKKEYFFSIDTTFVTKDGYIPNESDNAFIMQYLNNILK